MPMQDYNTWLAGYQQQQQGLSGQSTDYSSDAAKKYLQSQYDAYRNQQQTSNLADAFVRGQETNYDAMKKQYLASATPALQAQYSQAQKSASIADARRGVRTGSSGLRNQAQLTDAYKAQLANTYSAADSAVTQQRQSDAAMAQQAKMGAYSNPYAGQGVQGSADVMGVTGQNAQAYWALRAQELRNQQATQNMWSQLYGQQLQTAGNGISMLGAMR